MLLKKNDKVSKLFFYIHFGLIKNEELAKLVDARSVQLGQHLYWTLEEFTTITSFKSDIDIVNYFLQKEKVSLPKYKRIFFNSNSLKIKVEKYLNIIKFVKDSIEDINGAIGKIKQPPLSPEMSQAGFGKLNFGDLGMARTVGEFEGIGTIQAYSLPMHVIIQSLEQLAAIKRCEKVHQEIIEQKNKQQKYK